MTLIENSKAAPLDVKAFLDLNKVLYRRFDAQKTSSDAVTFQAFTDHRCYILIQCRDGRVQSDCIVPIFSDRELECVRRREDVFPPVIPLPVSPVVTSRITGIRFMTRPELLMLRHLIRLKRYGTENESSK